MEKFKVTILGNQLPFHPSRLGLKTVLGAWFWALFLAGATIYIFFLKNFFFLISFQKNYIFEKKKTYIGNSKKNPEPRT
jgi:hypothetical protein